VEGLKFAADKSCKDDLCVVSGDFGFCELGALAFSALIIA
jgi:hypothetical protein